MSKRHHYYRRYTCTQCGKDATIYNKVYMRNGIPICEECFQYNQGRDWWNKPENVPDYMYREENK